jgi:hypothetical protein
MIWDIAQVGLLLLWVADVVVEMSLR